MTRPWSRTTVAAWFLAAVALVLATLYFDNVYPTSGIGPRQPISFSHRVHAGVKQIPCRFCHPYVERSENAGLPTVQKCFFCHKYILAGHPEILKERAYLDAKTPVPWIRVYSVPDHVKFRHQPHVGWAKLDCARCHGPVAEMDRLKTVKFQMGFCLACHRQRGAQLDCWLACHH